MSIILETLPKCEQCPEFKVRQLDMDVSTLSKNEIRHNLKCVNWDLCNYLEEFLRNENNE